jgi:7-keto-8-aminopelargonate synthetase-like enzyme
MNDVCNINEIINYQKEIMNNLLNIVFNVINDGKNSGILHLDVSDEVLNGNYITINQVNAVNFSSCSYLGLEFDERLKEGATKAIRNYGTQFSASRAYLSSYHYRILESKFNKIFDGHCVVVPTTTLGHIATIPVIVGLNDAVILDHQVHNSVQTAVTLLKPKGIHIELIRHNRMDLLEARIEELSKKHDKVWYFADGIYSMYGDGTPVEKVYDLMDKHEKFHFYVDDAHGMSCYGKHGRGYVLNKKSMHPKMVLAISLAKAFATGGAVMVFSNEEMCNFVRTCGGPMITSGPMQPAALGAAIASADIHLSKEIKSMQTALHDNIKYANLLIKKTNLPLIKDLNSPVFFIGVGLHKIGYQVIKKMLDDGFYTNLGAFPAVPIKNTGVRFTITRLHTFEQIEKMIESMNRHFNEALVEHNFSIEQINKAFGIETKTNNAIIEQVETILNASQLVVEKYETIKDIQPEVWNAIYEGKGSFDYDGMLFLESVYKGNPQKENNWEFDYIIVKDEKGEVVLSTFFTTTISKDDMLSHEAISDFIENIRRTEDPYYLTSKMVMAGSLLTEGEHIYINTKHSLQKAAIDELFNFGGSLMKKYNAGNIMLRDFEDNNYELDKFMLENGYFKTTMPERHVIESLNWNDIYEYSMTLPKKYRKHFRSEVQRFEDKIICKVIKEPTELNVHNWKSLYKQIKNSSLKLNTFDLPDKLFTDIASFKNWDILSLRPSESPDKEISVVFNYISGKTYNAMFIGIDKSFDAEFSVYRQAIYNVLKRAKELNCESINLGFTATLEKKRFGAETYSTVAYMQMDDTFNSSVIESIQITNKINQTITKSN